MPERRGPAGFTARLRAELVDRGYTVPRALRRLVDVLHDVSTSPEEGALSRLEIAYFRADSPTAEEHLGFLPPEFEGRSGWRFVPFATPIPADVGALVKVG